MKRTIGYFSFTSEEERKFKEALYEQVELDKLYAGDGEDSFFEFLNAVLNDEDTLVISSFTDFGNQFMQVLHALDHIKHSNIDMVVLNGVHNEYFFGITTGQAAKVAKDFAHMLFSGKIR